MNLHINFHQIDPTDALKSKITQKATKLEKFVHGDIELEWTVEAKKERHTSKATFIADGMTIYADSTSDDLYKTFDDIVSKVERQIKKEKDKIQGNKQSHPLFE